MMEPKRQSEIDRVVNILHQSDNITGAITKAAVVANGEIRDYGFTKKILADCDYVVACDGGLRHCDRMKVRPDYIVGDLDSAPKDVLGRYFDVPVLRFPAEKDQTDLEIALEHVCSLKAKEIVILGGFGGRFDHQLANVYVMMQAVKRGVSVEIRDEITKVTAVDKHCRLHRVNGDVVTLLPLTGTVNGIVTEGLKYPLQKESLSIGFARGVSNRIEEEWAEVSVCDGVLLVIQTKEQQ